MAVRHGIGRILTLRGLQTTGGICLIAKSVLFAVLKRREAGLSFKEFCKIALLICKNAGDASNRQICLLQKPLGFEQYAKFHKLSDALACREFDGFTQKTGAQLKCRGKFFYRHAPLHAPGHKILDVPRVQPQKVGRDLRSAFAYV